LFDRISLTKLFACFSDFWCCCVVTCQEFDRSYGPGWQCIVGTDFGSFVTHHSGCFIYFGIGNLAILLFNGGAVGAAPQGATGEQARRGGKGSKYLG
jgi:hypothetical protein